MRCNGSHFAPVRGGTRPPPWGAVKSKRVTLATCSLSGGTAFDGATEGAQAKGEEVPLDALELGVVPLTLPLLVEVGPLRMAEPTQTTDVSPLS